VIWSRSLLSENPQRRRIALMIWSQIFLFFDCPKRRAIPITIRNP